MPKIEQFISLPSGRSFPALYHGIVEKAKRNPACAEEAKYTGLTLYQCILIGTQWHRIPSKGSVPSDCYLGPLLKGYHHHPFLPLVIRK